MRRSTAIGATAAACLALAAPAVQAEEWAAQSAGRGHPLGPVEQGEIVPAHFRATNTGTGTWDAAVQLATAQPADRASVLAAPDWLSPTRPARAAEATVAPGETGIFAFSLKASTPGTYEERFTLVHDASGTWMEADHAWHIPLTVIAAAPPEVRFIGPLQPVGANDVMDIDFEATDNVDVVRADLWLERDGQVIRHVDMTDSSYDVSYTPGDLPKGRYTARFRARDRVGLEAESVQQVEWRADAFQGPLETEQLGPARPGAASRIKPKLTMGFTGAGNRLRVTRALVSRVPKGATVLLRYGKVRQRITARGFGVPLKKLRGLVLDPRTTIDVTVTVPGMTGAVLRYRIARRPVPTRIWASKLHLCLPEGARAPERCGS